MYKGKGFKDIPEELRPREKMKKMGASYLSDEELLALILGSGSKNEDVLSLSKRILKLGWEKLKSMPVDSIVKELKGIGEAKACQIKALIELSGRIYEPYQGIVITSPEDVYTFLKDKVDDRREHLIGVYLSPSNSVLGYDVIAVGKMNSVFAEPKDVLYGALRMLCHSLIPVHTHPKGDPNPSKEDVEFTKRILSACELLGFELLDHIILTKKGYFSMKEKGVI